MRIWKSNFWNNPVLKFFKSIIMITWINTETHLFSSLWGWSFYSNSADFGLVKCFWSNITLSPILQERLVPGESDLTSSILFSLYFSESNNVALESLRPGLNHNVDSAIIKQTKACHLNNPNSWVQTLVVFGSSSGLVQRAVIAPPLIILTWQESFLSIFLGHY